MINTCQAYKGLEPKLDSYIHPNGEEETLICLDGTIPINYRRSCYHIPVCFYLRKDHPDSEPICYVRPTQDMTIKESRNVDSQGRISVPYLEDWNNTNELLLLIHFLIITFSETPPVYKKPESSQFNQVNVNRPTYPPSK